MLSVSLNAQCERVGLEQKTRLLQSVQGQSPLKNTRLPQLQNTTSDYQNLTRNIWPAAHEAEAGLCSVFSRAPPFLLLVSTAPTEEINRNTDPFSPLLSASGLLEPRPPRWTLKRTRTRCEIKSRIRNTSLEKDISCSTRRYPKEMRICYEIGIIATERYPLKMTD